MDSILTDSEKQLNILPNVYTGVVVLPKGEFLGDITLIFDQDGTRLDEFVWLGNRWWPNDTVFDVSID